MTPAWILLVAATLRAIGGLSGSAQPGLMATVPRCAMQAVAAWLAVLWTGVAVPVWAAAPALLMALALRWRFARPWSGPLADALMVLVLAGLATPWPPTAMLASALAILVAVGYASDHLSARLPAGAMTALAALGTVAAVAAVPYVAWHYRSAIWSQTQPVPFLGLALAESGDRITLPTGSVAWLFQPGGRTHETAVLFLHGAHSAGARQSTAVAFRAAFLDAGFTVLALETMGYGSSPVPANATTVEAWDEGPHLMAALRYLRDVTGARRIAVVGHSQGCLSALRSLGLETPPDLALLFGPAMVQELGREDYWLERFHTDRRLPPATVPMAAWTQIRDRYFNGRSLARALPPSHGPITIVHFELDHDDVRQTRGGYAHELRGSFREVTLHGTNHYLNTTTLGRVPAFANIPFIRDLIVLDTRLAPRLAVQLAQWIEPGDAQRPD